MMSDFPFEIIARVPKLVIKLSFSALKFKRSVKVSAKKLRKSMVKGGMDRRIAKQLANRYEEHLSIRKLLKANILKDKGIPFF